MPVPFDAVACSKRRQEYLPMTNQHAVVFVHMWTTANVHLNDIIVERCDAEFEEYGTRTEEVNVAEEQASPIGPDLAEGVAVNDFTGESLLGHVGDQDVLLVRSGSEIFAIDAHCTHYHGPLAEGL